MLATDTMLLTECVRDLDREVRDEDFDLDTGLICLAMIEEANRHLATLRHDLTQRMAEQMGSKRVTIEGAGTFERHRKTDRKSWDTDALLHHVLDTRLVNPNTGEVKDETPLEKVLAVWNLGAPRVTVLRERGLDPDEFAQVQRGGWQIQVIQ